MAQTLKFGNGTWATKEGSTLGYNSENGNFKPLPFSFDRASSATRVNKDGLIETVGSGEPRIDYKDDSKGALKLEPSRSNLITHSSDLSASGWDNVAYPITITSNSIISPDGSLNGTLITPSSGNSRHAIRNLSASAVSGTIYTLSAFVKKGGSRYIVFGDAGDSLWRVVTFDLDNGVVTNEYNSSGTITAYENGWYRITCVITRTNSGTIQFSLGASETDSNSGLPAFDNTSLTVYAYGCQIESNSSYATSYIPTQGSAVTRLADACSQTPPSGVIGQTEGTIYAEAKINGLKDSNTIVTLHNGSFSEYLVIAGNNSGNINAYIFAGGVQQAGILSGTIYAVDSIVKCAMAYKENDVAFYINGVLIGTDSSATMASTNFFDVGSISFGNYPLNGSVKQTKLYNTRLSNSELQALTS